MSPVAMLEPDKTQTSMPKMLSSLPPLTTLAMRCWTLALTAGLAASAGTSRGPALEHSRGLVPRTEMGEAEGLVPVSINVSAHLVTTPGGEQLSVRP